MEKPAANSLDFRVGKTSLPEDIDFQFIALGNLSFNKNVDASRECECIKVVQCNHCAWIAHR